MLVFVGDSFPNALKLQRIQICSALSWAFGSFHSSLKAWSKSIHKMEGSKILS